MKIFYINFRLLVLLVITFLCFDGVIAQVQGRFPTPEELKKKELLQRIYSNNARSGAVSHLMTTGPEQDCDNAIPVCQQSYTQTSSYTGHGTSQEVNGTCLGTQETNSVWYVFTVQNSGTFTFMLNTANDYDFALYDITTIGCTGVPSATPVRCNFSATYGSTGLTLPVSASTNLGVSASGSPTMPGLNVNAGQTFALIIDNFSANTNGYNLTFGGTAQIFDNTAPTIASSSFTCNSNTVRLNFSEPVTCASLASNGSDFTIAGPSGNVPVTSVVGNLCSTGASNTNFATVTFNNTGLASGIYTLTVANGSDGNSVLDKCGNAMSTSQTITFQYLAPFTISATNTLVCAGFPTTLTINPNGSPVGQTYSWAPGGATSQSIVVSPNTAITYVATLSYGGCSRSASQSIAISQPPIVSVNPANASLCSGTTSIVATAMSNGAPCTTCNYTWTGAASQVDNNVSSSTISGAGAGTYSVTVSSGSGCIGNTAVSNVSILSPSAPPSCDVIYVTTSGGGTGLTKSSPTTIQNALTMAACNAITIKMAVGDYSLTAPLNVSSYVTMEGGYNSTFTLKTSSTGTTGAFPNRGTRIVRTTTSPEGTAGNQRLTAINVNPGSSYFRLQDLTIEVATAAAGTKISNYAVYLGSGCNNYNIVRCKIDAGRGADGINGTNGVNGTPGGNGGNGEPSGTAGGGFGGAGGTSAVANGVGGAGGNGGFDGDWYFDNNSNGIFDAPPDVAASPTYYGTNGYGGGASQFANYAVAGTGSQGQVSNSETNLGGCDNRGLPYYGGNASVAGVAGINGVNGVNGSSTPNYSGGYFVIGADGTNGTSGTNGTNGMGGGGGGYQNVTFDEEGAGGGGGGGAGQAGTAGTGGVSAGAAFGIFSVNKGAGAVITDCYISALAGAAGIGGTGGTGGTGGSGGSGGSGCDGGAGGNGTAGGRGGNGGSGGNGSVGDFCLVCDLNGTTLSTIAHTNFSLTSQAVITVENIACSNINIDYTASSGAPINWTSFGATATPATGTGTPFNDVQYGGLGRKTISLNSVATVTTVPAVAAASYTNTASSGALGTGACPGNADNTISVSGYTTAVSSSGITVKVTTGSHTFMSDVSMFLIAPNGQILGLTNNRGNAGTCILTNITFADAAAGVMGAACPAAGSSFKPETATYTDCSVTSNITSFGALGGGSYNPNGTWTLRLVDNASGDGGANIAVNGWTLNIPAVAQVTASAAQADNYTDFTNIQVTPPSTGSVLASASAICPGSANFNSSAAGTAGLTYTWSVSPTATISSVNSTSTSISFANTTASAIIYTVTLSIASECCGTLTPVTNTILVNPIPAAPTATVNSVCIGGIATFTANTPSGSSFGWYNAASSGTLLATGSTYSVSNVLTPTTVYLQATNSGGCTSSLTPVVVTPTAIPSPTAVPEISCDPGLVTVGITPVSGITDYNWYSDAGGTVLVQSGNSLNYTQNIPTSGGSYIVYVQSTVQGCSPSGLVAVTGSVTGSPIMANATTLPNDTVCINSPVTISLNPSGGNGAYSYSWSPVASTSNSVTQTMTVSTSYYVEVTSGACSKIFNVPIVVIASPTANAGPTATLTCLNTTTVLSGSGGGSYSWSGPGIVSGGTSSSPTVNLPGTYSVTVSVSGCTNIASVSIAQNTAQPTPSVSTSGTVTCASNTLSLLVNPASMSYTWSAPAGSSITSGQNAQNASASGIGIYSVTVLNPINGCSTNATISANVDNASPNVSVNNATLTCSSTSTVLSGSVIAGATYTWSGAGIVSGVNSSTVDVNSIGDYTLTVTGANGCTNTAVSSVTNNTVVPIVSAGPTQTLVCGVSSVTLTGSATPSTSIANWLGGVASPNSYTTTVSAPGTYTLESTHPVSGCVAISTVAVQSSTDVPQATVDVITNSITCTNSVVTIGVTLSNSDPVSYSWSGPGISGSNNTASTTATVAGTYTVVITNTVSNCQASFNPVVPANLTPVTANIANPGTLTCNTTTMSLFASPTGTNYTYAWSGTGNIVSGGSTSSPVVSSTGDYIVTITDNINGCTGSYTVNVTEDVVVPTVSLTPNTVTTTCASPTVALSAFSSADPDVTYQWFAPTTGSLNNATTANPIANGYGTFTVVVTNTVNGCATASTQNTVEVYPDAATPSISVSASSLTITCTNTTVSSVITSTNTSLSYTWNPSPLVGGANPVFDSPGTYVANISAANGCSVIATVSVALDNTVPSVSVSPTQTLTCSSPSVIITSSVSPNAAYDYTWTGVSIVGTNTLSLIDVNGAGDYTLTVINSSNGCSVTAVSSVLLNNTVPTISISPSSTVLSCSNPTINLTASSSSTSSLIWATQTGTVANPITVNVAGDYVVSITDSDNGCANSQTVSIIGNTNPPTADAGSSVVMPCGANSTSLTGTTTSTNTVDYSWSGPNAGSVTSGSNTANPIINEVGTYTLTVTDLSNGCSTTSTVNVSQGNVTAAFSANPTSGVAPLTVNFTDQSTGALNYNWVFGDGNSLLNVTPPSNPINTFTTSGTYTVVLVVSSGVCTSTATAIIVVEDGLTLEIPNVFTPNNDGANDVFTIKSTGVKEISLEIFNRWGEKLYSAAGTKASWDGNTGQGAKVPDGTYFFMLKAVGFDDKIIEKQGYLNLYR